MGETSDLIRDTVMEKAAQVKDMADAALQEVKAQGLTPQATSEALHSLGETAGLGATAESKKSDGTLRQQGPPRALNFGCVGTMN
jgi:hypothetical protein